MPNGKPKCARVLSKPLTSVPDDGSRQRRGTEHRVEELTHDRYKARPSQPVIAARGRGVERAAETENHPGRVISHGHDGEAPPQGFVRQGNVVVDVERRCGGDRAKAIHLASNLSYQDKVISGEAQRCSSANPGRRRAPQTHDSQESKLWETKTTTHRGRNLGRRIDHRALSQPSPFLRAPEAVQGPPYPIPKGGRIHVDPSKNREEVRKVEGKGVKRVSLEETMARSPVRQYTIPVERQPYREQAHHASTPNLYFGGPQVSPSPRVLSPAHPVQPRKSYHNSVLVAPQRGFSVGKSEPPAPHVSLRRVAAQKSTNIISWS